MEIDCPTQTVIPMRGSMHQTRGMVRAHCLMRMERSRQRVFGLMMFQMDSLVTSTTQWYKAKRILGLIRDWITLCGVSLMDR